MILHAYMTAFHNPEIDGDRPRLRPIWIPEGENPKGCTENELLELAFRYGQNEFQPRKCPSVSVGDVIVVGNARYFVAPVGFLPVPDDLNLTDLVTEPLKAQNLVYKLAAQSA